MLYRLIRILAWVLLKVWNRIEITGLDNIPRKGRLIVVANHVSVLDPIVAAICVPRQVHFMAKKELFQIPVLGKIISNFGAFPVDRKKTDFQAVKSSLRILANQEVLGIFPEGGTRKGAKEIVFRSGTAAIALKSRSPVLPIAILGTEPFSRALLFGKLKVHVGNVISWPSEYKGKLLEEDIKKLTKEMEEAVERLKTS